MKQTFWRAILPMLFAGLFSGLFTSSADASIKNLPRTESQVVGDNETAAYIGTGGLLLSGSFSGTASKRTEVANCLSCIWALTVFCMYDAEGLCQHALVGCPVGEVKYRVWFGKTAASSQVIGSVCLGAGKPPTRRDIENRLDDLVVNYVPALRPQLAPKAQTLSSIPVYGWANQPELFKPPKFVLAGRDVQITAIPKWRWVWGDGQVQWTSEAGSPYPATDLSHTYRSPGKYEISVTTVWQASYQVEGIGQFAATGDILTQQANLAIEVLDLRMTLMKH